MRVLTGARGWVASRLPSETRRIGFLILALWMPLVGWGGPAAAGGSESGSLEAALVHAGLERSYRVHVPTSKGEEGEGRFPLVIVLHGGLGNGANAERRFGMNEVADREGFVAAYPDGIGGRRRLMADRRTWNAGECCGRAVREQVDDVGFIAAMIDRIQQEHRTDPSRVYVTGMSNGAMMTYRLVCELGDRIAAAVPVAGTLALAQCAGGRDVPILHIHGTADPNVPIDGGRGARSIAGVEHRSLADTLALVTAGRDCGPPARDAQGPTGVESSRIECREGATVRLWLIPGGGHVWPGAASRRTPTDAAVSGGAPAATVSASEAVWNFVRNRRLARTR